MFALKGFPAADCVWAEGNSQWKYLRNITECTFCIGKDFDATYPHSAWVCKGRTRLVPLYLYFSIPINTELFVYELS